MKNLHSINFLARIDRCVGDICRDDTSNKCYTAFLLFQGLIAVGGFERMWRISEAGGRIVFFKYVLSTDFTVI